MTESGEVKLHFLDYWKVIKQRAGLITLVFLLVMVTAAITTYFMPRRYLANVTMEIKPEGYSASGKIFQGQGAAYDPQFVATQFQILKKTEILNPVIQQLDLVKYYSKDGPRITMQQAFNILVGSLKMEEVRNTGLVEVGAWDTDPQMAADVANTISVVYRNRRMEDTQKSLDLGLAQFQDEVNKQRKAVEDAAVTMNKIRSQLHIVDPDPEGVNPPMDEKVRSPMSAEAAVNDQRTKVAALRTSLESIEHLKPEELKDALRTLGMEDLSVTTNQQLLQSSRVEEATLLAQGLGEKHPRILSLREKMKTATDILAEALANVRRSEAIKLQVAEETLAQFEKNLEDAKKRGGDDVNMDYVTAKTRYVQAKKILEAAETRLSTARMDQHIDSEPVKIWQRAEKPLWADYPPVRQYLFFAAFIGLVVGVMLAFFIEYLDTSVKTVDDVERYLKSSVLAVIPKGIPILVKIKGEHPDAEAYRILRANVEFNKPSPDAKTLTVISAGPGEGKSTTLNNLAYTCAKGGYNVLVIDADLRRPTQHNFFDTENTVGLVDYLTGAATLDAVTRTTKIDNLSFVPAGQLPPDAQGILNSEPMSQLIEKVKSQYDLIFFDSPPILGVSDGSVLASEMDMTVMVVQHRRFPRTMLLRVKQAIEQVGGALVGVVLNNVDTRQDEGYAYYNAYQDYYSTPRRETPLRAPAPRKTLGAPAAARHNGAGDGSDY